MRELIFTGPGKVEWHEVPAPALDGPNQALVRPLAVATCDLDAILLRGGGQIFGAGFPFGHECIGRILELSEDSGPFRPGDTVVPSFQINCGTCGRCRRGLTGNCEKVHGTAMYGIGALGGSFGGALSDVIKIPYASGMLVKLPREVALPDVASLADNVADAWRTVVPPLRQYPDAPVLVLGGGSIGLYAIQIALASGASRVDYLDSEAARLSVAEELGATVREGATPRRVGPYPITVEASGTLNGVQCAIRSTEPGGTCTSVGIHPGDTTPMPLFDMYITGMTFVTGRVNSRAVIPHVLALAQSGKIQPAKVTSRVVRWEDAVEALAEPPAKLVIARE